MDIKELENECLNCSKCELAATRNNVVFGTGDINSDLMFIGEGPGEQEDLQGEPFVGRAGQLLDIMLEIIGLSRDSVYICNIVKCRPPRNRDPLPEEKNSCRNWLDKQIELVDPKLVVCLGRISSTSLIDPDFKITKQHGQFYDIAGRRFMALYHPAALLRDVSKRPETFVDLKTLQKEIKKLK